MCTSPLTTSPLQQHLSKQKERTSQPNYLVIGVQRQPFVQLVVLGGDFLHRHRNLPHELASKQSLVKHGKVKRLHTNVWCQTYVNNTTNTAHILPDTSNIIFSFQTGFKLFLATLVFFFFTVFLRPKILTTTYGDEELVFLSAKETNEQKKKKKKKKKKN
jgi:hypothetical protein